jgi:hypothetical protein
MSARIAPRILIATIAILLGGAFYVFLRPGEALFISWIRNAGISIDLEYLRGSILTQFPNWMVYSMPDGLWAFGYSLMISSIWSRNQSRSRLFWLASIPLFTIGFELLQYTTLIKGTFCPIDLIFTVAGITVGYLIGNKKLKQ